MNPFSVLFRRSTESAAGTPAPRPPASAASAGEWQESSLELRQGLEISEHEASADELQAFADSTVAPVLDEWSKLLRRN